MGDIGGQILVYTLGGLSLFVSVAAGAAVLVAALWLALAAKDGARRASRALPVVGALLAAQLVLAVAARVVLRGSLMDLGAAVLLGPALTGLSLLAVLWARRRGPA